MISQIGGSDLFFIMLAQLFDGGESGQLSLICSSGGLLQFKNYLKFEKVLNLVMLIYHLSKNYLL